MLKQGLDGVPLNENEYERILTLCADNSPADLFTSVCETKSRCAENTSIGTKTSDIVGYLTEKMKNAKTTGAASIKIKSGVIHKELGLVSRMPMVCGAMRKLMNPNDIIHYQPPKGNGRALEIEYFL